jgi:hypothetical protein
MYPFCTPFSTASSIIEPCIDQVLVLGQIDAIDERLSKKWDSHLECPVRYFAEDSVRVLLQIRLH